MDSIQCPTCGQLIERVMCPQCGRISENVSVCNFCYTQIGYITCGRCGNTLDQYGHVMFHRRGSSSSLLLPPDLPVLERQAVLPHQIVGLLLIPGCVDLLFLSLGRLPVDDILCHCYHPPSVQDTSQSQSQKRWRGQLAPSPLSV